VAGAGALSGVVFAASGIEFALKMTAVAGFATGDMDWIERLQRFTGDWSRLFDQSGGNRAGLDSCIASEEEKSA
jgi:hypothetical protein